MIESLNRAFLYGESVFTTLRMVNGEYQDWEAHFERLRKGVEYVYGPFTDEGNWVAILKSRLEGVRHHETGDKVIRFTVYRHQARGIRKIGLISVTDLKINFIATAYEAVRTEGRSVKLRTCVADLRPYWWPSYLKAGNYLEVILAQKVFLKEGDDDLLFLSSDNSILESSVANIFVVRHNKLYTAPKGPNVLDGITRRKVLEMASDFFHEVLIEAPTLDQAINADAVFGSNSVRGLFLVNGINDSKINFSNEFLEKFDRLQERVMK